MCATTKPSDGWNRVRAVNVVKRFGLLARPQRCQAGVDGCRSEACGPTVGRSKNSATVEFISPERLVAATFWDSGEGEVITAFVRDDDDPSAAIHRLPDSEAIVELLDRVGFDLTAPDRSDGCRP
jgi:hypothetical protein